MIPEIVKMPCNHLLDDTRHFMIVFLGDAELEKIRWTAYAVFSVEFGIFLLITGIKHFGNNSDIFLFVSLFELVLMGFGTIILAKRRLLS